MKKAFLSLVVLCVAFNLCKAQDTVKITDNHYLSHFANTNIIHYGFPYDAESAAPISESYIAPTDTTTIYGVVIPMSDWIWFSGRDGCKNMSVALCKTHGFFDTIDSINNNSLIKKVFLNAGHRVSGHLGYSPNDSENLFVHGLEVYFDHPHSIINDLPDTFFIAKEFHNYNAMAPDNMGYYWPDPNCPHHYIYHFEIGSDIQWIKFYFLDKSSLTVHQTNAFSSHATPIVKLRSDPPKGFRLLSHEGNSATVAWRGSYDVESYQLSIGLFGENPDDGEIVTLPADSAEYNTTLTYTFDNLDYGVRHAVWIRKSCRYTTAGYDTLVWGPWSSPAAFFMVGIDEVDNIGNTFRISPNPTSGTVTVELAQPAPYAYLQLIDLQGRVLEEWIMRDEKQTLDVSHHPAGTYLLKLTTPTGTAVRQVMIAR